MVGAAFWTLNPVPIPSLAGLSRPIPNSNLIQTDEESITSTLLVQDEFGKA